MELSLVTLLFFFIFLFIFLEESCQIREKDITTFPSFRTPLNYRERERKGRQQSIWRNCNYMEKKKRKKKGEESN